MMSLVRGAPMVAGGLLRRSPVVLGANIKIYREKVILYTKLQKNIKTFKNVTTAKYLKAQERTKNRDSSVFVTAKLFQAPALDFTPKPDTALLMLNITTNRGTCGALNSRQAQNLQELAASGFNVRSVVVGKKGTDALAVLLPERLVSGMVIETDHIPTNAALVAQLVFDAPTWDLLRINFTRWASASRQDWAYIAIPSFERFRDFVSASAQAGDGPKEHTNNARLLNALKDMDEETLRAFWEFHAVTAINYALEENSLSELAARMVAVENQLQNISKLRLWAQSMYNKTRQATVTAELLELTSAAAAMESLIIEEEAMKAKGTPQVLDEVARKRWLSLLGDKIRDLRVRLLLAERASKPELSVADVGALQTRLAKYVRWRGLVAADEERPPEGVTVESLRSFLTELPKLWEREVFELKLEELRLAAPPTLAGQISGGLAAAAAK